MTATLELEPEVAKHNTSLEDQGIKLTKELDKHILCCKITVHMWRGQFKIRDAKVKVGEIQLNDELITNPRWKLLPDKWAEKFNKVEQKINNLVDRYRPLNSENCKFPLPGVEILPRKVAPKVFRQIKQIEETEFHPLVDEFVKAFPSIVETIKTNLTKEDASKGEKQFNMLLPFLPRDQNWLRDKFWIEKQVVPIKFAEGAVFGLFEGDEAEEFADEIGKYAENFSRNVAQTIVAGLHEEMAKAVANLEERIATEGVVKGGTLGMVRRSFEKIKNFSFCASPEMLAKIQAVEQHLSFTSHREINEDIRHGSGDIARGLSKVLADLTKHCAAESASLMAHGRTRRTLE